MLSLHIAVNVQRRHAMRSGMLRLRMKLATTRTHARDLSKLSSNGFAARIARARELCGLYETGGTIKG